MIGVGVPYDGRAGGTFSEGFENSERVHAGLSTHKVDVSSALPLSLRNELGEVVRRQNGAFLGILNRAVIAAEGAAETAPCEIHGVGRGDGALLSVMNVLLVDSNLAPQSTSAEFAFETIDSAIPSTCAAIGPDRLQCLNALVQLGHGYGHGSS
jgi:hypothetical protein